MPRERDPEVAEARNRDIIVTLRETDFKLRGRKRNELALKYNITPGRVDQIWYEFRDTFRTRAATPEVPVKRVPTKRQVTVPKEFGAAYGARKQTVYITLSTADKGGKKEFSVVGDIDDLFHKVKNVAMGPLDRLRETLERGEITDSDAEALLMVHASAHANANGVGNGSIGVSRTATVESGRFRTTNTNQSTTPKTETPTYEDAAPAYREDTSTPEQMRNAGSFGKSM